MILIITNYQGVKIYDIEETSEKPSPHQKATKMRSNWLLQVVSVSLISRVACFQVLTFVNKSRPIRRNLVSSALNSYSSSEALPELKSTSKSYVTFNHPVTNTEVTLIGCLHGSSSSANDVLHLLNQAPTDVVVLELCPTRYKDLMREIERRKVNDKSSRGSYIKMVTKTIEARGLSTGLAAAILGGASGISTFFSGFVPGLEFLKAIEYVDSPDNFCDVVLADRMVDETLRRVGALPSVSLDMFKTYVSSGFDWKQTYGEDAIVLTNAVSGSGELQLDMRQALVRNKQVIFDLLRLTLPTFLIIELVNICLAVIMDDFNPLSPANAISSNDLGSLMVDLASSMTSNDWGSLASDFALEAISSAAILFLGKFTSRSIYVDFHLVYIRLDIRCH